MCGLVPCVQMDAYTNQHSPEGKMIPAPYFQVLQAVVVYDPAIDPLTGSTFAVYRFIFFGIPWDTGMKSQITVILYVNGAPVTSRGTFLFMRAGINAAAF